MKDSEPMLTSPGHMMSSTGSKLDKMINPPTIGECFFCGRELNELSSLYLGPFPPGIAPLVCMYHDFSAFGPFVWRVTDDRSWFPGAVRDQ